MSELKEQRLKNHMTQREAAEKTGISLRSYISYENEEKKREPRCTACCWRK